VHPRQLPGTQREDPLALFLEVAARAEAQQAAEPGNANAFYWQAYALGRYSQGISVAQGAVAGLGGEGQDRRSKPRSSWRRRMPMPTSRWAASMPR
jgi:hypothetical protein